MAKKGMHSHYWILIYFLAISIGQSKTQCTDDDDEQNNNGMASECGNSNDGDDDDEQDNQGGRKLPISTPAAPVRPNQTLTNRNLWIGLGVGFVVIIVIMGALSYFCYRRGRSKSERAINEGVENPTNNDVIDGGNPHLKNSTNDGHDYTYIDIDNLPNQPAGSSQPIGDDLQIVDNANYALNNEDTIKSGKSVNAGLVSSKGTTHDYLDLVDNANYVSCRDDVVDGGREQEGCDTVIVDNAQYHAVQSTSDDGQDGNTSSDQSRRQERPESDVDLEIVDNMNYEQSQPGISVIADSPK